MNVAQAWQEPLRLDEAYRAIAAILRRMDQIQASCGEGFPLYCTGADNQWKVSAGGSWLGGFWSGLWWLRAHRSAVRGDRRQARQVTERLRDKLDSATHHRSLIFHYGAGLGGGLLDDAMAKELAEQAVGHLARAFDPLLGCITLGRDMGGGEQGDQRLSIDPLAATLHLFARRAEPRWLSLGRQQLQASFRACAAGDGAWSSQAHHENGEWRAEERPGDWSRGQAWALLGLSVGARLYGAPYRQDAVLACQYWQRSRGWDVPRNRLSENQGPDDPCSAAMVSLALQGLAPQIPDGEMLLQQAGAQLAAIIRSGDFHEGRFVGHCYRVSATEEQKVESACGSFFLLAALLAWTGELDPGVI
ncbi:glucuronyl hydrolase [Pseudomonas sp. SWRI196]|uniref:Glucuronyl hydrolase n=1 Tax=Pseudomonas tehranensis TaxID=2745502 RepID=A0ABR6ULT1_9PSED|nr:glucuronyl hydrolase [Pseudomonas tehranensis]MBC3345367.1 glucuronyl hydrolase [Pseudomonas tehranensis]